MEAKILLAVKIPNNAKSAKFISALEIINSLPKQKENVVWQLAGFEFGQGGFCEGFWTEEDGEIRVHILLDDLAYDSFGLGNFSHWYKSVTIGELLSMVPANEHY